MNNSISEILAVFAVTAVTAFSAGAAGAAGPVTGSAPSITNRTGAPQFGGQTTPSSVRLIVMNGTQGCARAYANGRHNIASDETATLNVGFRTKYVAAVYKGACNGKPFKSVSHTTSNASNDIWVIR